MNKNQRNAQIHPKENAKCCALISYSWLLDLFRLGYKRDLEESDLYTCLTEHSSEHLGNKLNKQWSTQQQSVNVAKGKKRPKLARALFRMFGVQFMMMGVLRAFYVLGQRVLNPILLGNILNYFSPNGNPDKTEAAGWAIAMCSNSIIEALINYHVIEVLYHMGIKINVACSSMIYRKILRLAATNSENGGTTVGQVVNILSNDVGRFDGSLIDLHDLWIAPIQLTMIAYIIYTSVDWTVLVGIALLLTCIPFLVIIGKMFSSAIPKAVQRTDSRLKLMNEIIKGIQTIKMYAWEKPFCAIVEDSRIKEMISKKKLNYLSQLIVSFETYITKICFFISIASYVSFGNEISAKKVYMLLSYYDSIKSALFISFPLAIQSIINAKVSINRIENFLMLEEKPEPVNSKETNNTVPKNVAIYANQVSAKWDLEAKEEVLKDITFKINFGSMLGIVGQVGSGKSSLLQVMTKELPVTSGFFKLVGKIAYTSQEPWIFSSSIRQNILFGQPFNQERYDEVTRICQLQKDFSFLPYGDKTTIGDRGINLSGGQRARINLARAVYSDADVYLFDDPLSAVDAEVGKRIFEDCLKTYLRGKTIILVTHQIQYTKFVDHIICLNEGRIAVQGEYSDLLSSNTDFAKYLSGINPDTAPIKDKMDEKIDTIDRINSDSEPDDREMRTRGKLSTKVYTEYMKSADSMCLIILIMIFTVLSKVHLNGIGADYLVSFWVNENEAETNENVTMSESEKTRYIIYHGSLTVSTVISSIIVLVLFFEVTFRISKNLHSRMFGNIIHATMSFFYTNPSGRILSRFSKDIQAIDERVPTNMYEVVDIGVHVIFTFILISYVNPFVIPPCAIILIILYFIRDFYIRTIRSVKRLEGLARSPMFDHLTATFHGIPTIRAFKAEEKVTKEFQNHLDLRTTSYYISVGSSLAFGMYVNILAAGLMATIIFIFIFAVHDTLPGDVGLILTQILSMIDYLQWGIRITAELENQMISVERVLEYTKVDEEPPFESSLTNKPPENWPQFGRIVFLHLCIKYDKTGDRILNNLNFEILPEEKIGIVGRTGAGKSSIIAALFRLAFMEGEIYIDDVPIRFLGVHDLRSRISIIPQEPLLFNGTLRKNLDPFGEYKDAELWQVLEEVKLKKFVEGLVAGLETKVLESGSNYSVGQRQLLCLARTILRKNKILILDEATANVDLITDELIQTTIRDKFKHCTVLTIAHRLNTIIDCNRVLVMDHGNLIEYDNPYKLLEKKSGFFYELVQQTGQEMSQMLTEAAKNTCYGYSDK